MQPSTAILLFSRSAAAEAVWKFGASGRIGKPLSTALIRRTRQTLQRSGLPVYAFHEDEQRGDTFGARLTYCMERVFAAGHEEVIVVGNDCPDLSVGHLGRAADLLARGHQVLGRDGRGGVWILGMTRAAFDADALRNLRWQTAQLATDLSNVLRGARELCSLRDVNELRDLRRGWWRWKGLFAGLFAFLHRRAALVPMCPDYPSRSAPPNLPGRAPPAAA